MSQRKQIAAILTEYRPNSHADVIVTKFLKGFPTDDGLLSPRVKIASMYVDQFPENDLSRGYAAEFGVPIYPSIVKALTLGGEALAVDGVLLIWRAWRLCLERKGPAFISTQVFHGTNLWCIGDEPALCPGV